MELFFLLKKSNIVATRLTSSLSVELKDKLIDLKNLLELKEDLWNSPDACKLHKKNAIDLTDISDNSELSGAQELTSLQWIITTAKSTLRYLFEHEDLPNGGGILEELTSLKSTLDERKSMIQGVLRDTSNLLLLQELCNVYKAEILLLIDMINSSDGIGGSSGRTEEECMFTFSKLCHRQFDIESILLSSNTDMYSNKTYYDTLENIESSQQFNTENNRNFVTPTNKSNMISSRKGINSTPTSCNPLWVVMQNVFPSDELNK
jgi:hypothetical protein